MSAENPLIQKLRDMLAFSSDQGPNVMVMTTQESVRAVIEELELLRAIPGGATEIHVLANGSHVTGERAASLLDDEMSSHAARNKELANALQAYRDLEFTAKQLVEENQKLRDAALTAVQSGGGAKGKPIAANADVDVEIGETTLGRVYVGIPHFHASVQIDREQATRVRDNLNRILQPSAPAGASGADIPTDAIEHFTAYLPDAYADQNDRAAAKLARYILRLEHHTPAPADLSAVREAIGDSVREARNADALRQMRNPQHQLSDDEFTERILSAIAPHLASAAQQEDTERLKEAIALIERSQKDYMASNSLGLWNDRNDFLKAARSPAKEQT